MVLALPLVAHLSVSFADSSPYQGEPMIKSLVPVNGAFLDHIIPHHMHHRFASLLRSGKR